MPRGRRHRSSSSRSRPRSISWSRSRSRTPRSVKKKYRESYDSPYYKHSYSSIAEHPRLLPIRSNKQAVNAWDGWGPEYGDVPHCTERAERSRVHERGTSAERRYKRSHRRSPTSRRRHRHHRRRSSKHKDSYDSRSPTAEVSQLLKTTLISTTPNFFLYFPDFDAYLVLLSLSLPSLPFSSLFLLPFLFFLLSLRDF